MEKFMVRYTVKTLVRQEQYDYWEHVEKTLIITAGSLYDAYACAYDYLSKKGYTVHVTFWTYNYDLEELGNKQINITGLTEEEIKRLKDNGVNRDIQQENTCSAYIHSVKEYTLEFIGEVITVE